MFRRFAFVSTLIGLAGLSTSCSTSRELLISRSDATDDDEVLVRRERIRSYTVRGGERISFEGKVEPEGNALRFVTPGAEAQRLQFSRRRVEHSVPRDSVTSVTALRTSVPRTFLLVTVMTAAMVLAMGWGMSDSWYHY